MEIPQDVVDIVDLEFLVEDPKRQAEEDQPEERA